MTQSNRFFVVHLDASEVNEFGGQFEVQLLNANGQAEDVVYVNRDSQPLTVGGVEFDHRVIMAASDLPAGTGIYVNDQGREMPPF